VAELTRAQRWQDVGVGLVSELQRSEDRPGGRQSDQFVGLQFSLPLPFWNRNQGRIREAAVVLERRQLEQAALDLKIQTEQVAAREQLAAASSAEREVAETLLPAARRIEEQLLRLRDQGQATFVELARVREKRLQLEVSHIEARRDVLRAYLQLQFALGQVPHFSPAP
jgi:cobalt-zinc-cadmium efflux system outer membrane protein